MIGIGSPQVYSARVQPVMERIVARRLERAASDTREAPRREGAERAPQAQETARTRDDGVRAAALSFSSERALAARFTAQNLSSAEGAEPDPAQNENRQVEQAAKDVNVAVGSKPASPAVLSSEEKAVVNELKARDSEVRNHERAHKAAGGQHAGAISFTYQSGPDGRQYAVGGEVPIDISPEQNPEATIQKMNIVIGAALAPAEPSGQDQAVARAAQAQRNQALAELNAEKAAKQDALRSGGEARAEKIEPPNAPFAVSAQENIYDLLRAVINGAPENRVSTVT